MVLAVVSKIVLEMHLTKVQFNKNNNNKENKKELHRNLNKLNMTNPIEIN